ncbi:MAG: SpoIID/LytB domain-containing protein [Myxococcales bacterium]|nr:SpoIID/LytB domain-containing protein [Myxococcales bacterium]
MSHRDRLAVLYSNQVVFDRSGEPLVSVRITEGQEQITVQSRGRLTLLPGGDDGARIRARAGTAWTVHLEAARPGEVRWWTIVEELPAGDLDAAADARRRWSALGGPVKLLESGALIGLAGQTLDTRRLHVGVDPQPTRAEAEAVAERLATGRELRTAVIAEPTTRPGGWIVARDPKTGFEVRARDLLWLTPEAGHTIDVPGLEWGHGTPKRGRADRRYHGDVYLAVGSDAKLTVVNVLSAETLLEGVVPAELFPSAPPAALRAQAVAARGQLLAKVGTRHRSDPYLLCAETHCQVYAGDSQAKKRTTAAVRATRGQLLFDAHGLVDTTYSSACGGHSEAFHQMWGGAPKASSPGRFDLLDGATDPIAEPPITDAAVAAFIDRPPTPSAARAPSAPASGAGPAPAPAPRSTPPSTPTPPPATAPHRPDPHHPRAPPRGQRPRARRRVPRPRRPPRRRRQLHQPHPPRRAALRHVGRRAPRRRPRRRPRHLDLPRRRLRPRRRPLPARRHRHGPRRPRPPRHPRPLLPRRRAPHRLVAPLGPPPPRLTLPPPSH